MRVIRGEKEKSRKKSITDLEALVDGAAVLAMTEPGFSVVAGGVAEAGGFEPEFFGADCEGSVSCSVLHQLGGADL